MQMDFTREQENYIHALTEKKGFHNPTQLLWEALQVKGIVEAIEVGRQARREGRGQPIGEAFDEVREQLKQEYSQ